MKNILFIIIFSLLINFSVKANPWLIFEGIGIGVQVLEAGAKKIGDANKKRKAKKRINNEASRLKKGSKIVTFLQCNNLQPNYLPNAVFKIDLENNYIKIDQGKSGKAKLSYLKIDSIQNSKIISNEAFSPITKKQKKLTDSNKYIDITHTFDVKKKTIKVLILLEPNAPKKIKKAFARDIKKGKLTNKTNANCGVVLGERFLIKEKKIKTKSFAKWVAIAEHKEKNIFYSSDNKIEINTKEKAINDATSKCWFDPNHKAGDWPSENCEIISVKSIDTLNKASEDKLPWTAQSKHPKSYKTFIARNHSTRDLAVNIAMKKCYEFVTKKLEKYGYNDCYLYKILKSNIDVTKKTKDEVDNDKKKIANAARDANKQWITENKQDYLDKFNLKLDEYKSVIDKLSTRRNTLITKVSDFKIISSNAIEELNNIIDDLENRNNREIKILRNEIRENKRIYLSTKDLKLYVNRLEYIKRMDFKKYERYFTLEDLIERADKSDKAANFVGKDGVKIFGIKFTQNKIGYIQEFRNIKDKDLGLGYVSDNKIIDKLNNDIDYHNENINRYILNPLKKLSSLDAELSNKFDYINFIKWNPFYWIYYLINNFVLH